MLKYYDYAVTFAEFPDEIALCLNITNCPGHCEKCSEPWLLEDIGTPLTDQEIRNLVDQHPDCTVFGLMGGDADHQDIVRIAQTVKKYCSMKVGFYSGQDLIDCTLIPYIDYYKIGRWIHPKGEDPKTWGATNCGPLCFPFSNQLFFEKKDGCLVNATYKFRKQPISNFSQYII